MKIYYNETEAGYKVVGIYKYGYEFDIIERPTYNAIIFYREIMQDYGVALNYDFYKGTWGQGIYNFRTEKEARDYLKRKYIILTEYK